MQIVIDIDDNLYTRLFDNGDEYVADMRRACVAIRKGTPLPEGHGDLIDELDLDLTAPSLGADEYINDLMAKHNIDYVNGDDEDKVRAFAMDLIYSCNNVIKTAPTIIEADKTESEDKK